MRAGLSEYDAIVVGSGPNGLGAAIVLAGAGRSVLVLEANETIGGGMRSAELTRPGFVHDVCSAIHPMALGSPFLRELPLAEHGLELIHPPSPLAHPFDDGTAAILERSVEATAKGLGADAESYRRLMGPLAGAADAVIGDLFGPLESSAPSARHGAIRALRAALRERAWPLGGSRRSGLEGCSPVWPRTPCCRSPARSARRPDWSWG